jgi:hypothetical protein
MDVMAFEYFLHFDGCKGFFVGRQGSLSTSEAEIKDQSRQKSSFYFYVLKMDKIVKKISLILCFFCFKIGQNFEGSSY